MELGDKTMGGICGFYGFEDKNALLGMIKVLSHRGPDGYGLYTDENVSLGHARLSIIDLSERGNPIEKKHLYFYWDGEKFIFAPEIKAIFETGIKGERGDIS